MTQYANPGAALGEGLNTGADFANKVIGASRDRQKYHQQQAAQKAAGDAIQDVASSANNGGEPSDEAANANAHSSFLQSLGQGLSHIGTGINNFFAGAPAAGVNPAGLPPQAGVAPAPGGAPGAIAMPAGPNPQAAPVGLPQAPGAPTMGIGGGAPAYMQNGGPVGYYENGGPVATGTEPRAYLADGGPVPTPGAALGLGLNQGAQAGQAIADNARAGQQFQQNQDARKAAGDAVENFAAHLHGAGLDDTDTPNHNDPGHPAYAAAQNPQQLLAAVSQDSRAQQGLPEKGNNQPHSITTDWWDNNDKMMAHAAAMAAYAGHDPDQAYQALNHMRTSFVQGHMLRAASAASVALQNGDMKAVEQNLRNMNYYLPDGKDLAIQKDGDGNLVYQNPLQQYVDAQGNPTDAPKGPDGKPNRPNMVPVDQAHIQQLGQAILDPMKVNDTLMATRAAAAKQRLEAAETQAKLSESQAKVTEANTKAARLGSQSVLDLSHAQYFRARGAAMQFALSKLANQKLDPTVLRGSQAAATAAMDAFLGPKKQVSDVDADGQVNMSPAAGKVIHDSSRVDPSLRGATAMDQAHVASVAANLYAANARGGMSAASAAQLALQVYGARNKTHPGPDGKPQPNAYTHEESGEVGIWNPQTKMYTTYKILPGGGDAARGGQESQNAYLRILAGAGGDEANSDNTTADDNAPAQ